MQGVHAVTIKRLTVTLAVFLTLGLILFSIGSAKDSRAATTGTFNVTLSISNSAPTITYVNGSVSESPNEGTIKNVTIYFQATDINGADDINISTVNLTVNRTTEPIRTQHSCASKGTSGNVMTIECNVTMYWYDEDGAWTINASIKDNSGSQAENTSQTMTYGTLSAMTVTKSSLSFSGTPGDENVEPTENPQVINNTGNQDFTEVNLTGYDLQGNVTTTEYILVGNFTVNVSDSSAGYGQIVTNTSFQITGASLARGATSTEDIYLRLDIPSGITAQGYNAHNNWMIEVK